MHELWKYKEGWDRELSARELTVYCLCAALGTFWSFTALITAIATYLELRMP